MIFAKKKKIAELIFELIDLLIIYFSYYISVYIFNIIFNKNLELKDVIMLVPFALLVSFALYRIFGVLDNETDTYFELFAHTVLANLMTILIVIAIAFGLNLNEFASKIFVIVFVIETIILGVYKYIVFKLIRMNMKQVRLVFFGTKDEYLQIKSGRNNLFATYLLDHYYEDFSSGIDTQLKDIGGIIIGSISSDGNRNELIDYCIAAEKDVYIVPDFVDIGINRAKQIMINEVPLLQINRYKMTKEDAFVKRGLDFVVSIIGIIICMPLMVVIGVSILLFDNGSILYRQERLTTFGKHFNILKFRTMVMNAEDISGPVLTVDKDERVTRIGLFLRKTRLDELPQLFNVLIGDMSLVGPRPERPCFSNEFETSIPNYPYRLYVKAGITGLAQIMGSYSMATENKLKYDLMYITNYSILMDLYILVRTIKVVFFSKGSKM